MTYKHQWPCQRCDPGYIELETEDPAFSPDPIETIRGITGIFCEDCKLKIEREWIKEIVLEAIKEYYRPRAAPRAEGPHRVRYG